MEWREDPPKDWGRVPGRCWVHLDGSAFHSGMQWRRQVIGECRHKGKQWHAGDLERLMDIGDMEIGSVTHWAPIDMPTPPDFGTEND